MKTPTLTFAAIASAVLLAVTPSSAEVSGEKNSDIELNGWYKCGPSTFGKDQRWEDDSRDEDYYLETSSGHRRLQSHEKLTSRFPFLKQAKEVMHGAESLYTQLKDSKHPHHKHHHKHHHKRHHEKKATGYTDSYESSKYECAQVRVPMCHEGICSSDKEIDLFVKRVVADENKIPKGEKPKALWVLQGGPGASSSAMESLMETMYSELDGAVSIYTMDHRGTARSHRLECSAVGAMNIGSPDGPQLSINEVPECIEDVRFQIDNHTEAFSVTSAATDLQLVIEKYQSDMDVFVYGLSYGTYLTERLIHLAPAPVIGYAIDGIVSESGKTIEERSTYSNWDHDMTSVGDRFLDYCMADSFCKSKFPGVHDLSKFTRDLYQELDAAHKNHPGSNECADVLASGTEKRPSYFLRFVIGELLLDQSAQPLIPAIIYRANRCSEKDVEAFEVLVEVMGGEDSPDEGYEDVMYMSEMLYYVIVFSEMWEHPTPDKETLIEWFEEGIVGSYNYQTLPYYCLFTGSKEQACTDLVNLPKSKPLVYERDEYWNETAKLPSQATALLMSGGMDVQTREDYGYLQYNNMDGPAMLVRFDDATHCTVFTTPMRMGGATCAARILASYVKQGGVLDKVDTSCVDEVVGIDFGQGNIASDLYFDMADPYN